MRLRNIPRAESVLEASKLVIKNETGCRGKWKDIVFQNNCPIHIEVGMGKGQFILALARKNPDINYIGIERYSSVLLRAVEKLDTSCQNAETPGHPGDCPNNLRFICMNAADLTEVFAPGETERIYLNFSDPWPKARHARRRLTSTEYFRRYDRILAPCGQVEFKTDNRALFDFSVEQLEGSDVWEMTACTYDLHHDKVMNDGNIMTEYEEKFSSQNHPICKLIAKRYPSVSGSI